ncbi:MAG: hypothetical protein M1824_006216 [Vezdaea acicularis]|nr:MAG: hypothetical protein M1824_006216 [Vezdaea acicularis]
MDHTAEGPFGLHIVYDPPGANVDIIAVHGLGSNPKYAWTRKIKDAEGEREVKWLEDSDLLPAAIPNARIFTFGYESKWHKDAAWQRRSLCAVQLLDALYAKRQQEEETKYRPLIFIGHSFGGVVIEQALVDASQHDGPFLHLSMSTIGIVFLGTPHRGTEAAKWGELIATSGQLLGLGSETRILQDLRKDSLNLVDLLYSFTQWLFRFSVPIVCFFEKHKTDFGKKTDEGKRWRLSWKELVVEERSACIDGHRKVPVQTDHLMINKFSGPNDESYKIILSVLQDMIKRANEKIQARLNPHQIIKDNSIVPPENLQCLQALFGSNDPTSFRSIDPRDVLSAIHRNKGDLVSGTCEWLLDREEYVAWLNDENISVLWLLGGPGTGKTMLSSFLVDKLEERLQRTPKTILVYFFCDNKDANRNRDTAILRGLMLQILRQLPSLFKHIQEDYELQPLAMFENFDTLWRIFLNMLKDSGRSTIYILLDALDECEPQSRSNLVRAMSKLSTLSRIKGQFKLLITSRPSPESNNPSEYERQLHVDSAKIDKDLDKFIEARVAELPNKWPATLIRDIKDAMIEKKGGTFLWISYVLDDLSKTKNLRLVKEKLRALPAGLKEVYDQILDRIDKDCRDDAKLALRWVVGARRPLTVGEFRVALGYSSATVMEENGLPSFNEVEGRETAVDFCENLLYHDAETDTINLYHESIKDYLLSKHVEHHEYHSDFSVNTEETNLHIFEVCWRYLSSKEFHYGRSIIENIDGQLRSTDIISRSKSNIIYEFLGYAVYEWFKHALALQRTFLRDDKLDYLALERSSTLRDHWLLEAAKVGQEPVILKLLEKGANVYARDSYGGTALYLAAVEGHEAVVRLLLENGADVEAGDDDGGTALYVAAERGHTAVIRLLLEKVADADARGNKGWAALRGAAQGGHEAVMRLLLENGTDIEASNNQGFTALSWAAERGHEAVVRLLLENRADIEANNNHGFTALSLAAERGHETVVRLLLENGADIEAKDDDGGTALCRAANEGHETVVQLLLEKGANVDARGSYGGTALCGAANEGHEAVVRLLLENGADVNARGRDGMTALEGAAWRGHEAVVRLLLENGANVEARDDEGRTAIFMAAREGHEAVVWMLLENGADVDARDSYGRTALYLAARRGHEAVMRLLSSISTHNT